MTAMKKQTTTYHHSDDSLPSANASQPSSLPSKRRPRRKSPPPAPEEETRTTEAVDESNLAWIRSRSTKASLEPISPLASRVRSLFNRSDCDAGAQPITAAVKSVEDNGYVLELGLEGITSFIAFDAAQKAFAGRLVVGQLIAARIAKVSSNGRTATLKLDDKANKTSLASHSLSPGLSRADT